MPVPAHLRRARIDLASFCGQLSAGFSVKNKKLFDRREFFLFRKRQGKVARTRLVVIFCFFSI